MKKQPASINQAFSGDQRGPGGQRQNDSSAYHPVDNQRGQVMVELALLMPFLAMILLALVIIHEFSAKHALAVETMRQEMRESMDAGAAGAFRPDTVRHTIWVNIPGKMKQVFNAPFITRELKIEYYKGSYQGFSLTKYHNRGRRIREINL